MDVNMNSITGFPTDTFYTPPFKPNPVILIIIVLVIIIYYSVFSNVTGPAQNPNPNSKSMGFLAVLLWGVFIVLIILNGFGYFYNMDITASLHNILSDKPEVDILVDQQSQEIEPVPEIKIKKQVFHIPDNKYNYENAKAICQAYGGRLANWKDMDKAFKKGADWCGYGWSEDQMALYPTQLKKWKHLQTIKGHENDCGRPGINGGYIDNPNVRFGINCYGYKPQISQEEANAMRMAPLYPRTRKELEFEKRVNYWKNQLPNIDVSPFNHNVWSSF